MGINMDTASSILRVKTLFIICFERRMASRERNNVEDIESIKAGKRAFDFLKMNNARKTMRREIKDIKSVFRYDETSLFAK
jgi:hypothetical protein